MHDALTQHASRTTVHTRSRQNAQVVTDNKVVVKPRLRCVRTDCSQITSCCDMHVWNTIVVVTLLQGCMQ